MCMFVVKLIGDIFECLIGMGLFVFLNVKWCC